MSANILYSRSSAEVVSALASTARRLGVSQSRYIEQAVVRAIAADADKVAASNVEAADEIARLSESANALIALSRRDRPGASS